MKKTRSSTKVKTAKTHTIHAAAPASVVHVTDRPRRTKKAGTDQRSAFLNTALDRYAIPFIRQVEAKLVSWQATL